MSMGLESLPKKQAYIFSFPHWNTVRNRYENYESGQINLVWKNFQNFVNISRYKFSSLAMMPASYLFKFFIIWALDWNFRLWAREQWRDVIQGARVVEQDKCMILSYSIKIVGLFAVQLQLLVPLNLMIWRYTSIQFLLLKQG